MITIFSDGGSRGNPGHAASAYVIYKNDEIISSDSKYLGKTTNNVAEYNGVILALEYLEKNKIDDEIKFCMDSELVVKQLSGIYKIKDQNLLQLSSSAKNIIRKNNLKINFVHVPRALNAFADNMVNEKLDDSSRL